MFREGSRSENLGGRALGPIKFHRSMRKHDLLCSLTRHHLPLSFELSAPDARHTFTSHRRNCSLNLPVQLRTNRKLASPPGACPTINNSLLQPTPQAHELLSPLLSISSNFNMANMDIDFTRRNKKPRPLSELEKEKLDEYVDAIHYSARLVVHQYRIDLQLIIGAGTRIANLSIVMYSFRSKC